MERRRLTLLSTFSMWRIRSPTTSIWSTSSSVITTFANRSSITIINSRRSSQSAPRSSVKCASSVTRLTSTPRAALSQITQGADRSIEARSAKLTGRTPRRSGHRRRCVAYRADIARPSDGQECNQDNEGNPNINAHQSSPATGSVPRAIGAGQCCRLSKQVELALFFDAKLDLAAPQASGNASIASLANSIASSFEYLAEDVRSLLDSLPAMLWPSKRLKYANHL